MTQSEPVHTQRILGLMVASLPFAAALNPLWFTAYAVIGLYLVMRVYRLHGKASFPPPAVPISAAILCAAACAAGIGLANARTHVLPVFLAGIIGLAWIYILFAARQITAPHWAMRWLIYGLPPAFLITMLTQYLDQIYITNLGTGHHKQAAMVLGILALFVCSYWVAQRRFTAAAGLFALALGTAVYVGSSTVVMMGGICVLVMGAQQLWRASLIRAVFFGAIAVVASAPWLFGALSQAFLSSSLAAVKPGSFAGRADIWLVLINQLPQHFWLGAGGNSVRLLDFKSLGGAYIVDPVIFHAHNIPLGIWYEFGVVGVAVSIGLLWALMRSIEKLPKEPQAQAVLLFSLFFVISLSEYTIWHHWILSVWGMSAVLLSVCASSQLTMQQRQ